MSQASKKVVKSFAKQESNEMHSFHTLREHFMLGATMLLEVATRLAREQQTSFNSDNPHFMCLLFLVHVDLHAAPRWILMDTKGLT